MYSLQHACWILKSLHFDIKGESVIVMEKSIQLFTQKLAFKMQHSRYFINEPVFYSYYLNKFVCSNMNSSFTLILQALLVFRSGSIKHKLRKTLVTTFLLVGLLRHVLFVLFFRNTNWNYARLNQRAQTTTLSTNLNNTVTNLTVY